MDPNRDFRRGSGNRHGKFRRTLPKGVHRDYPGTVQQMHGLKSPTGLSISAGRNYEEIGLPAPRSKRKHVETSDFCPARVAARHAAVIDDHTENPGLSCRELGLRHGYSTSAVHRILSRRPVSQVVEINTSEEEMAKLRARIRELEEEAQISYRW